MSLGTVSLRTGDRLPPLPRAFLEGESLDLLEPIRFVGGPGSEVDSRPADRGALAGALGVANAAYGHPRAESLAERLADPETRVVVTGQQPGFLGGPLYTLSKAVAAVRWAGELEARGEPAVAVFWVATEDHDYREVANVVVLGTEGPQRLSLGEDANLLTPVGMRTLGPGVEAALDLARALHPSDRWAEWMERVAAWYRPDARFGEAFSRLIVGILGERAPLMLDSMLPELKTAQRPWLRRLVERRFELGELVAERERAIVETGFQPQVKPAPGASPLFLLRGESRRRIQWIGDGHFGLRGEPDVREPVESLLETIEENPSVVSPGVMARTALQDATLGTGVVILGPGEVSYMPQVAPVYRLLGIDAPLAALRPQAIVLPERQRNWLEGSDLGLADLLEPLLDLERAVSGGEEDKLIDPIRRRIEAQLEQLRESALALDRNLEAPWGKTRQQIERALSAFSGRLAAAAARRREADFRRLQDLRTLCLPLGGHQERSLATAYFPGRFGDRFVEAFFEQLGLEADRLHVISP